MALFLASLAVFFLSGLAAWAILAGRTDDWLPPDAPPLPGILWLSTALIAAGSFTAHRSVDSVTRNRPRELGRSLAATLALGIAFLVVQSLAWADLVSDQLTMRSSLAGWLFYFLTGLHAAHVLGGLVAVGIATRRAFRTGAGAGEGIVRSCAMYWHFLGVVWVVLFVVLSWR